MPNSSIPGYVARYGAALQRLIGAPPDTSPTGAFGTVTASRVYDPTLSPGTGALAQEASQGLGALDASPAPAALQPAGPADAIGALGTPPPPAAKPTAGGSGRSFWDIVKGLKDSDKEQIADSFEKKGVDVPAAYEQLKKSGQVDPGMVKTNPDGTLDRKDMAMFLLESGLRTMQAAGKEGSSGAGAVATGQLDTMDARRGRASALAATDESTRRFEAERADKASAAEAERKSREKIAAENEAGANKRTAAEIEARGAISDRDNLTRKQVAEMARGASKSTFVDEEDGLVYWADTGEPVMVNRGGKKTHLKGKTQQDRGVVTEKDILTLVEKHRAALDENLTAKVTIPGEAEPVRWSKATDEQKNDYLSSYGDNLRLQSGEQTPKGAGTNPFDQFD